MWTRNRPFPALNDFAILLRVTQGKRPERPAPEDCRGQELPGDVWILIGACWAQDAGVRPRMTEVLGSLTALSARRALARPWDSDSRDEGSSDSNSDSTDAAAVANPHDFSAHGYARFLFDVPLLMLRGLAGNSISKGIRLHELCTY
jgi:hypothetical protein